MRKIYFSICLLVLSFASNAQSFRTPAFTGALSDFTAAEQFAAAANNTTYVITFDATYMYFGAFRTVGSFGDDDNFTIYLDTDPRNTPASGNGTTAGRLFNGFTPTLPFNADYTSITQQNYTDPINRFNGGWASTGVTPTVNVGGTGSNFREVRIALADIGNPASVYVSLYMGYAGGIYSNAPGTSNEGTAATRTLTGFFGSFPVHKAGITPATFRAQNTTTAPGGGTAISNLTVALIANNTPAFTAGDYGDISITGAFTSTLTANTSYSGALTVGVGTTGATRLDLSTFTMSAGGRGIGGTAGQLVINGASGTPINSTSGTFAFLGGGLVSGANPSATLNIFPTTSTVTIGGAVDFGAVGGVTVKSGLLGTLLINAGGSILTNPPTYGAASTLIYNTGGTYTANSEWTPNLAFGQGVPNRVTLQNNTALNFGASTAYRRANGLVTIGSGSSLTLSSAAGGYLVIVAGLTNNNTAAGVGLNTNGRAVENRGTGTYTKIGTDNLDFLIIGTANTLTLASGTNLNLTNTSASGCLQFNAVGSIFMAGTNTVTIPAGGTVGGATAGSFGGSVPTTSILNLAGACNWSPGGVITSSINVGIQVNAGLSIATAGRLAAGYVQINQGGFVSTNPVVYVANGTLVYNHSSGVYGVTANEFPSATGPFNLTVTALGGGINMGSAIGARTIPFSGITGTVTLNQNITLDAASSLTVAGTTALTGGVVANATATINGAGAFTLGSGANFTTANPTGVNGTITTSGTKTFGTTNIFAFNGNVSQVTGVLMPTSIGQLIIANTAGGTNGVTISNNTLAISGNTTLTSGALILPTAASNLVTFTGNISTPLSGGTITGSATSNIATSGTVAGTGAGVVFTTGGQNLSNWTCNAVFGSATPNGLNSPLTINGTFSFPTTAPDLFTTSLGVITFASGSTFNQNGLSGARILGVGSCIVQAGANMLIGSTTGLAATTANGAIQTTVRTFSGGANYTFNNFTAAQAIGDALDAAGGTGKTGPLTGNVNIQNNVSPGVTLNAGTTITINGSSTFNIGVSATSSAILTAPATSIINGSGTINMFGNGTTNGSTLRTANANGVNGTFQTTTTNLTNAGNNNTNFTFNGTALAQVTGTLMPVTVGSLISGNATAGSSATTPAVLLSSSTVVNGTLGMTNGHFSINGQTLTANGIISVSTVNTLCGTASSNFIVGGSGLISGSPLVAFAPGNAFNNFTMNRSGSTLTVGAGITVSGTLSLLNGITALNFTNNFNGPITITNGTVTATGGPILIGGSGAISGSLLSSTPPLTFTAITMNRASETLTLGSNTTVSNATGLTLTAGNIALGAFNLTNTNTAGTLGTGSTGSHVVATGAGKAFMSFAAGATAVRTFPIGDGTNYSPASLTFTANTVAGTVGVNVTDATHPQYDNSGAQTNYLSRYWNFATTGLTNYTYTSTFGYIPADINGTEALIKLNRWTGAAWVEDAGSVAASNLLTSTTGLTQATGLLNGNDFTGRVELISSSYTWNGSNSNDWATAANWTPPGIPAALDNVTINVPGSNTNCTINSGTKSVATLTLNGTGALAMLSTTSLTVTGAVTYGGSATANFDCASTFIMNSAASQAIAPLNYGNLNLSGGARVLPNGTNMGVCGTFTPGAGAYTITGSTIDFNGAAAQTIPVFNYNNLTSSNTGARTLPAGTVGIAGAFTPGTNAYTTTGNTVNFNGTSTQSVAAFPSYNNLTISGARGAATVTLASGTIGVAGAFAPTATAVTYSSTGNTFDYTSAAAQTIIGFNKYNNLSNSGNGARTLQSTPTIVIDGTYTPTTAVVTVGTSTIDFSSAATQPMPATFYYNVTNTGNGPRTWANTGIIDINNGFAPTTGTSTITGSTLRYSSTATGVYVMTSFPTNIVGKQYNNLILVGSVNTGWELASGFNLGVAGNFSGAGNGDFSICNNVTPNTMTVDGDFNMSNDFYVYISANTAVGTLNVTGNLTNSGTGILTGTFFSGAGNLNVTGNMTLNGTSPCKINLTNDASAPNTVFNIGGNLTIGGSASINMEAVSTSTGSGKIVVAGDFTATSTSSSLIDWGTGSSANLSGNSITIAGNYLKSGTGQFTTAGGTSAVVIPNGGFIFNKAGTQTFNYSGTASSYTSYTINTGSTLQLLADFAMGIGTFAPPQTFNINGVYDMQTFKMTGMANTAANSIFNLNTGGTIKTANPLGLNDGTASSSLGGLNVTATKNYSTSANYEFSGAAAQNTNFPTAITTMNNLTINNSAADVKINKSINVNGNLIMTAGNLDLNGSFNISLAPTSSIVTETATKAVINTGAPSASNGFIGGIFTLAANPGNLANLGMDITTATAMGSTIIQRFPKVVTSIPTSLNSVKRVYSIQPTTASNNSVINFNYFDSELNSNSETAPALVVYSSNGANETVAAGYAFNGATAVNTSTNIVTQTTNITTLNTFHTLLNDARYITVQTGDWNTTTTWLGGNIPPASSSAIVRHAVTVNATVAAAPNVVSQTTGGSLTFGAAGNLTVNNTFTNGGSGIDMTSGGTLNLSNNATLANGANTFTGGTGTVVFAGAGNVSGTIAFNNIIANGGLDLAALTTTINGAFTLNAGAFVNPDAPSYGSSSTLVYNSGGTYDRNIEWGSLSAQGYPNNIIIQNGTTVNMNTNALAANYGLAGNLKLGNATSAGNLDMNNAVRTLTVGGNVEIGDATGTSTLTLSSAVGGDLYIKGNWIRNANGVFNPTGRGVFFNGATAQTLTGATTFDYLLMSQAPASTLTLNNNINIVQTLTFGTGKIVTAGNIVIMNSTASATGASTASYINGVQQYDVASPVTRSYDIGDASVYAPVTSVFTAVSAGGALKVSTSAGDHVNILTSAIDETKTANRTWSLTSVAGLVGTHNTTFNFVAGDLDGAATTSNFTVGNYNAAWAYPTVGVKTGTSTQATGVNSFGDFQLGECRGVTVVVTNPPVACSPATVDITAPAVTVGSSAGLTYSYFTDAAATLIYTTPTNATNGTYYIKGTSASGCFDIKPVTVTTGYLWLGVNTNWNNTANWCNGTIPTGADNITIPSGAAFYPIIPSGQVATTGFLDIAAGASMQVTGTGVLNLFGNITNAGILDLVDGTLRVSDDGSGLSPLISISGLSIKDKTVKNFIVATYVEISNTLPNDTLKVTGLVSFLGNNNDLVTHDNLTLVSNAAGTASIGDITNGAFMNTGNTITGKVIIERYLPGIKAWRLLAAPVVTGATSPTITDSWREGGTGLSSTGYGTRLTGPGSSNYGGVNNLDEYSIRASMKSYNMGTNNFTDITESDLITGKKIANDDGYYIFIRGDRGITTAAASGTETILQIKGQLRTGNQTFGVDPSKFRSIGNPFPSRLDMRDVYLGAIKLQSFYVWNPAGVGNFNAGQYVGYTLNVAGTGFFNGITELNYIESGQAFFVQNNDAGALNLVIKETDKTTGSANVSRGNATSPTLEINLKSTDVNGTEILADGAMLNFDNAYNNGIDNYDVKKITNSFDNIAIKSNATSLLVERKTALVVTDSIHLNISNLRTANFKFEIDPSLLVHPELIAYLKDRFLQKETEVSLTSVTNINFVTTSDAASKAANRFVIVFRPTSTLPVTFVDIAAIKNANKTHTVKWVVANELNIQQYEVERSSNGSNFESIGSTAASQQNDYNLDDAAPLTAINFYRVKAISQSGQVQYSTIIKLNTDLKDAYFVVTPNPVQNKTINLQLNGLSKGSYTVNLINSIGQKVFSHNLNINGDSQIKTIGLSKLTAEGKYTLQIISSDNLMMSQQILILPN